MHLNKHLVTLKTALEKPTLYKFICLVFFPNNKLLWNFTNLCLVSLNITHQSNHVLINRLQRRVRNTSILFSNMNLPMYL